MIKDSGGRQASRIDEARAGGDAPALDTATSPDRAVTSLLPSLFMAAVEQAPVAISITDSRANILYANAAFTRVTGYPRAEIIGRNESVLSHKVTPRALYEDLWRHLTERRPWTGTLLNRGRDGEPYLAEVTIAPVADAEGQATHFIGMHRDITEVHRLERELRDHMALVESVFTLAPVAIVLIGPDGARIRENAAYLRLRGELGCDPAEHAFGALGLSLAAWEQAGGLAQFKDREVGVGGAGERPARWLSCSTTRVDGVESRPDAFFEPEAKGYLLLALSDVSVQRRRREELRISALRAQLTEHELTEGVRETVDGAVFQLDSLVGRIGAVQALIECREQPGDAGILEALSLAREAGEAAKLRLSGALPPARRPRRSMVNLNEMLRDVLAIATPRMLAAGVMVDWRPERTLPPYWGDPVALQDLFRQLIENALDALDEVPASARMLTVRSQLGNGEIEIAIEDSGQGIAREYQLKIFEPFYTTRAEQGRAGMGLAIVQNVINAHDALIWLDAEHSPGASFHVVFPLSTRTQRRAAGEA
ncbi:nitrogen fixation negative regulator NifL [Acidihalobacter prosperus]|uniref:histidine kinase n=1 Tax=Acidihalobacter prosperus TaxID=160660 RepID=A0A1A6C7T2_9GAMM|nr:nitrogen fixation negative regulator NifL [Acidihalobacter prosperus]OBS10616.1 nitrogen fixation negative regulator NifL [Acidihalobacter prosperus]